MAQRGRRSDDLDAWPYWSDDDADRPNEVCRAAIGAAIIAVIVIALIIAAHFLVEIYLPDYSGV